MKKYKLKSIYDDLAKYDYLAKEDDFIEISEWNNGEGYDIKFSNLSISLSHGQIEAINYLIKSLEIEKWEE